MVASSPVRHEPPAGMQQNPIDVQSYQAPWKALSEFAMGPGGGPEGMDHPGGQAPFQQLVSAFGDSLSDDDSVVTEDEQQHSGGGGGGSGGGGGMGGHHVGPSHPPPPPPPEMAAAMMPPFHHGGLPPPDHLPHLHHLQPFHHHHAVPPLIMTHLSWWATKIISFWVRIHKSRAAQDHSIR